MLVEDREYSDGVVAAGEIDRVRKAAHEHATRIHEDAFVGERVVGDALDGGVQFEEKLNAQARLLRFVPGRGGGSFGFRARLERDRPQVRRSVLSSSSRTSLHARPD